MCCGRFISVSLREAGTVSIDISEFVSLVNRKKSTVAEKQAIFQCLDNFPAMRIKMPCLGCS